MKKVILILAVLVAVSGLFLGYNALMAPDVQVGAKTVTLEIVGEKEGIDTSVEVHTDAEYLEGLLNEQAEALQIVIEGSDYGPLLIGMEGYVTDFAADYWGIFVNGEFAMVGIADQTVYDGDVFRFELTDIEIPVPAKAVTIEIVAAGEGLDKIVEVSTDQEFLEGLLNEQSEALQVVIEGSAYGPVLMGLEGYVTDFASSYWGIFVNDEFAMVGIADQVVVDGDVFRFELTEVK